MFAEFLNAYGPQFTGTILNAVLAAVGMVAGFLWNKFITDKRKRAAIRDAVLWGEQVLKDLHGDEKLNKVMETASELLAEKGIRITALELLVLTEAAVAEFNKAFDKTVTE